MAATLAISRSLSFYENAVFGLLSKMDKGRLHVTLHTGESVTLGDGAGNVEADIKINSPGFFKRCVLYGDIGFGEAYVDGDWDTGSITDVIKWFLLNIDNAPVSGGATQATLNLLKFFNRLQHWGRANNLDGSRKNISDHYDLNNDFFSLWLDPSMTYSSAYFEQDTMTLEEAQRAKYRRLCKQMHLRPGLEVLEIGSGWGANAMYMASEFGCNVTSITISEEQCKLATERVRAAGLEGQVKIMLEDYRKIKGQFDRVVSVEMLEAVGDEFLDIYFQKCTDLLRRDGFLALQVITSPDSRYDSLRKGVDWIQKHIFPGSLLPSVGRINEAVNRAGDLSLIDLKDMGRDYARTLAAWRTNFNGQSAEISKLGFDERFLRKWNYYLCYCEAAFSMRNINVMQLLYSRPNNPNW
ncbi:MAG: cyclopropane-fatty-acyl-phospholipid synthase [Bacteroidetes bacterium]|nr:MAG: cyclopropane-fatty-acyl-phospholipid synthase [Bacteroidota bacterium]